MEDNICSTNPHSTQSRFGAELGYTVGYDDNVLKQCILSFLWRFILVIYSGCIVILQVIQIAYRRYFQLEIRSMERGICPIAVFYFRIKTFFLYNVIGQQRYQCYQILAHMTSSVT